MAKLIDLYDRIEEVLQRKDLLGTVGQYRRKLEIEPKANAIGKAIAAERGISLEECKSLPDDTELGKLSQPLFDAFCAWIN